MQKLSILKLFSILFCLTYANAIQALGYSPWTTVTLLVQGPGSYPLIQLNDAGDASTGCPQSTYFRFNDVDNSVAGKRHFSTILLVIAAGKEVRIKASSCSSDYPYVEYIDVRN